MDTGFVPTAAEIDAYRRRIGYDGPLEPSLEVLKALQGLALRLCRARALQTVKLIF